MKSLYIQAALSKNISNRPPVWMMRQAGRYLPEYRAIREKHGFMQVMKTPDLACEITLQPIRRFGMDSAILFSDILVTAEALGSQLHFDEGVGPVIDNPVRTSEDIFRLRALDVATDLSYAFDAIRLIKKELTAYNTPLIGFCGAPFTVASYMIEGRGSQDLKQVKRIIGDEPDVLHRLLDALAEVSIVYLTEQVKAGADALQIFDTWAGLLSHDDFKTFALPYHKKMVNRLRHLDVPLAAYCRHSDSYAPLLAEAGFDVVSVDWQCDIAALRNRVPRNVAIQGNLDPYLLLASPEILEKRVLHILDTMKQDPGFIFNLGHGVFPEVPPDSVKHVVRIVKSFY